MTQDKLIERLMTLAALKKADIGNGPNLYTETAEALTAAQAEIERLKEHRQFLWDLLDNIDTLDDACKEHDKSFRERAYRQQRRRYEISSSDGYTVTFKGDAPQEGKG